MNDVVERIRGREGYGYCPFCQSNVLAHEDHHLLEDLEDAHVRITPDERDSLLSGIDELREALITIADRLEDEGCQCDASDEYVYKCNLCIANDALGTTITAPNPDKG